MQCVILAGGLGTRMHPLTQMTPKTLIPIADTPFADYQLTWLAQHGVSNVVYSIGFLGEQIRAYVGDGSRWGLDVSYVEDGKELAGTAGALRRAYDSGVLHDWILVLYGDSFLPFDFQLLRDAFLGQARPAMMAVYQNHQQWDTSNVCFEEGVVQLYDKAQRGAASPSLSFIDYGVTALQTRLIAEQVPVGTKCDLSDLYNRLSKEGLLAGLEVKERFYEIGSRSGLVEFKAWAQEQSRQPCSVR